MSWMRAGPQKLKRRPPADEHVLKDDDGVVTIRKQGEDEFNENLEATIEGMRTITSNDDNSNASIQPYQTIGNRAEDNAHGRNSGESDNENNEYLQNAQRFPDIRLDTAPGSQRTPEVGIDSVQNPGNVIRDNNQGENRRDTNSYDETPSFLDIAPDLSTRSPTFQRKMFEDMDEKMRNFAQSQRREKIRLQSH